MQNRVLIITSPDAWTSYSADVLAAAGVPYVAARLGGETETALADPRLYALAIVEIAGPDGRGAVARLRADRRYRHLGALVAACGATPVDVYEAFEAGASDVLPLPMDEREYLLRVRAHLRRATRQAGVRRLELGDRVLDFDAHHVLLEDMRRDPLTPRETAILEYLVRRPGRPSTTEELLVEALGYPPRRGNPEVVRTHVRHLRQKVEPDPTRPRFLVNVPRVGYRLELGEAAPAAKLG
ncbi:MAG: response regulator transcription factor [Candidatus Sericytochromatia bacterium]|nr:response regulator transcription factor [Candidatus Tanganyikabacteria bacterium]